MCVSVCLCVRRPRVRFASHNNATTNKSLISSFLPRLHKAQPNPWANTPSVGRRESPTCGLFVFKRNESRRRALDRWIDGKTEGLRAGLRGRDQWWGQKEVVWRRFDEGGGNRNNARKRKKMGWVFLEEMEGIKSMQLLRWNSIAPVDLCWALTPDGEMKQDCFLMNARCCLPRLMVSVQTPPQYEGLCLCVCRSVLGVHACL